MKHLITLSLALLLLCNTAYAEEITCGPKTITVQNGNLVKIRHEDGTVHSGGSVSRNWNYDGSSIMHRLLKEKIPCGTAPLTREETVADLAKRFTENPDIHGMNLAEGKALTAYVTDLMNSDNACHLLVDGAKSVDRADMFWIDCNDRSGTSRRTWITESELMAGTMRGAVQPISEHAAVERCNKELRARTQNPSTYDPDILTGTSSRTVAANGRNVVEIRFSAANALGVESEYNGRCILEGGNTIEVMITEE